MFNNFLKLKFFFINNLVFLLNLIFFIFIFINFAYTFSIDITFASENNADFITNLSGKKHEPVARMFLEHLARLDGANPDDVNFQAKVKLACEKQGIIMRENMEKLLRDNGCINYIDCKNLQYSTEEWERRAEESYQTYLMAEYDSRIIEQQRLEKEKLSNVIFFTNQTSLIYFYPELFLLLTIILLLILNLFFQKYLISYNIVNFNIYIILFSIIFTIFLLWFSIPVNIFYLNYSFVINNWVINSKIFVLILVFFIFLMSLDYFKFEKFQLFEFPLIILLSILGMFILISSNDFIVLYLAVELQSFCFYILSALKRYSNLSIEASLKYFILGSFSSGILLFGISLVYGFFGTLNFLEINNLIFFSDIYEAFDRYILFSMIFIIVGVLFKLGVVPFHFWLPDVYEGSPAIITAFFSIVAKFSFLVLFIKLYFFVFLKFSFVYNDIFLFLALMSTIFGSIMSLYQIKIKRLLAYSSISHMGFILIALSLFSIVGLQSFLMYIFIYTIMSLNIFSIMLIFRSNPTLSKIRNIVEFSTLLKSNFFLAFIFALNLLSFAGVPPLAGFFGKFLVFQSLIFSNNYFISLCVVLLSVLSSVYYIS